MAFLTLEDLVGSMEIVVFPRDYEKNAAMMQTDARVFIQGRVSAEDDKPSKLICEKIFPFAGIPKELWVQFPDKETYEREVADLYQMLHESDGKDSVILYIKSIKAMKKLPPSRNVQADARLVDYNTEMYYGNEQSSSQGPLQVPYLWWDSSSDPSVKLEWAEFYYQNFLSASCAYFCPSREMLKLYDTENDMRYKYLMCENFSWRHNIKYTYPGYVYFRTSIPYGTTVQEMILTKAECLARQGKFQQAMETVNILRAKRIAPGPEVKLSAATKEEAIAKILEERVRELTWGLRWFDIRR